MASLVEEVQDPSVGRIISGEMPTVDEARRPLVIRGFPPGLPLDDVKKIYVLREIEKCGGNKMKAARSLNMNIKTLYNNLKRWGIEL